MANYKPKNVPTIDAIEGENGTMVFMKDGKLVSMPKAEFDTQYEKT